jgi:hypothetical protein
MATVLIAVRQDDSDWRAIGIPNELRLTDLVVDAIDDALGTRPLERRPSNAGPATITSRDPLEFSCPVDCEEATVLLLHALESTDEPLSVLVTGRMQREFVPEHVDFDIVGIRALKD